MHSPIDIPQIMVPTEILQTNIRVIAGGPCSGKTSLITALQNKGYNVEYEPAELILQSEIRSGNLARSVRKDARSWQTRVVNADIALLNGIDPQLEVFIDTSIIETYVYCMLAGLQVGTNFINFIKRFRFLEIYFMNSREQYKTSEIRIESNQTALQLSYEILHAYEFFHYKPIHVPKSTLEQQLEYILLQSR